ncbi:MAG: Gfo/Idh/MocA family protein [Planctomycetota bacterium]
MADIHQGALDAVKKMIQENTGQSPDTYLGEDVYKTKLLARDDIDAVFLATPCYLHGPMYLDCFAAGKHFYGEKPMCTEINEADALVKAQKKNPQVTAQIGFQRRASKRYEVGIQKMRDGVIGNVYRGVAAWNGGGGPIGLPKDGPRVWLGRTKYSGDWMLEQACHTWDVLSWAIGELPVAVSGSGNRKLYNHLDPDRDVTDYYLASLDYANGLIVDYSHCWAKVSKDDRRVNGVYEYFVGMKGGIALNEGLIFPPNKQGQVTKLKLPGTSNDSSILAFYDAVRKGTKTVSTVESARMATLTGLLVRKAVYENRRVKMTEITG